MDKLGTGVANDVLKWPLFAWSKAYQNIICKAYCVNNNMCKDFDGSILEARTMHKQRILDTIRVRMMKRIVERRQEAHKWVGNISPSVV